MYFIPYLYNKRKKTENKDASQALGITADYTQAKVILKKTTGTVNGSQRDAEQCAGKGGDMFERSELPRPKLLRQAANSKILPNE